MSLYLPGIGRVLKLTWCFRRPRWTLQTFLLHLALFAKNLISMNAVHYDMPTFHAHYTRMNITRGHPMHARTALHSWLVPRGRYAAGRAPACTT